MKRIIISNGKKYVVNTPGWNDEVGPGSPPGTLWLQSETDGLWYEVKLTGAPASSFYVNPTPLTLATNDLGYQYVLSSDGNVYRIYLTGTGTGATVMLDPTALPTSLNYKSNLYLQSVTDEKGYGVYVQGTSFYIDTIHTGSIVY